MKISTVLRRIWITPIILYRYLISPILPNSCIYTPSCSTYSKDAILRHGILKGSVLAASRISRCAGGLFDGGDDPVPEEFSLGEIGERYRHFRSRKRN